ncbi:DUF1707 domain-containing protein [Conexibacter sp. JD483]|uniref:DUF1707 SHOCT-like domain-containing protein n=1 Tax=unclassified Conexibacter TaxID=2627773 RepID=UPI002717196D|nr:MULTISPECIES: DUF1707 domain-containing protein [unclassified Conexibacter]MDO8188447.1 DUF1707 domain-containing protein [Conexibacter sp. CPCC 205706]MDO8199192.1 DUF1707 domain-containing protein [Conexibacter sp. CPCC 205762]MDR9371917.1 DUF1707 domain-containing protein [Conexibacter sp. JD483]
MSSPEIRASDAEREQTIERLRLAAGEGRLTLEELADRVESVAGSRTRAELEQATIDLPPADAALVGTTAPGAAAPASVPAGPLTGNSSVFGDLKRSGPWQLPARSGWSTVFGDVVLDLREARVPAGEIAIDARSVFGDIELLVPEGVLVDLRGRAFFGDVKQQAGLDAAAGAPRIVLTGSTVFGDVRVRARRLRERLAARLRGGGSS